MDKILILKKVIPLPIGFENKRWEATFGPKTKWLIEARNKKYDPVKTAYLNCNKNTSLAERQLCYDSASQMKFISIDEPNLSYVEYLERIKQHKFVLSPRGNGLDCHRDLGNSDDGEGPSHKKGGFYGASI